MADGRFISYLRVSTTKQGATGLGIEAQRAAVTAFLNGGNWNLIQEVVEVESGKKSDRPKLREAMSLCRVHGATLVIAKLDRLSRDVHFLTGLQKAGVRFLATDMPEANEMVVQIMAAVAQAEAKMISKRTKDALAAAKARGTKLGGKWDHLTSDVAAKGRTASLETRRERAHDHAHDLAPIIDDLRFRGAKSLRQLAAGLNERGIPTARGGEWSAVQVKRVLDSLGIGTSRAAA